MCAQEKKFPFNSNAPFLILKKKMYQEKTVREFCIIKILSGLRHEFLDFT